MDGDAGRSRGKRIRQGAAEEPQRETVAARADHDLRRMFPPCELQNFFNEVVADDTARLGAQLLCEPESLVELSHRPAALRLPVRALEGNDEPVGIQARSEPACRPHHLFG